MPLGRGCDDPSDSVVEAVAADLWRPARTCSTSGVAWRIKVDYDECEANAVCVGIAPEVFDVDDDDNLNLLQERPTGELVERVRTAVDSCPKRALFLEEVAE